MGLKQKLVYWMRQFPFVYPRKIVPSCREWIQQQGGKKGHYFSQRGPWHKEIFSPDFIHNPEPKTAGEPNDKAFYINRSYPTAAAGLFYLQNAYVFGHKGLILSKQHEVFQEFSHNFGISSLKKTFVKNPFYIFTRRAKMISGVGAVLISPESYNYYHWLNDVLPRIRLYQDVFNEIEHFCIASNVPEKFVNILEAFGIPEEKLLRVHEREKIYFNHLYVASLPGSEGRSPAWAVDYLRSVLIPAPASFQIRRKLYFLRGDAVERRVLNEADLKDLLKTNDFEMIDPGKLTFSEQVKLAAEARVIISAHGAALSNLLFASRGITVIELFSPDYFRTDCFYTLSSLLALNYWYLAGEKPAGAAWGNIAVNKNLLLKTLNDANTRKSNAT
jgi:hypothetical protein